MRLLLVASLFGVSCVVADLRIEGHACPCPDGYACDEASNTCVARDDTTGTGITSTTSTGTTACVGLCGTAGCGACPEVPMVDAGGFSIDAYEVPRGDYARFLADEVDFGTQSSVCTWNDSYDVIDDSEGCGAEFDYTKTTFAMTCVDWCDAAAFCAWAGKRMCGRKGGGTVAEAGLNDATRSEWYSACSEDGAREFPYGATYEENFCNTAGNGGDVIGVGSFPDCEGGYSGIFDMVGNAEEWEDACELSADPKTDNCVLRGGAFWADATTPDKAHARCESDASRRPDRNAASHDWGFRCCRD